MDTQTLQHVRLFDKCKNFTKAREIQKAGLYPYFKPISQSEDTVVTIEGKGRIMMGSNNYLGLTHHPDVLAASRDALERYGSGCTGSRTTPAWIPRMFGAQYKPADRPMIAASVGVNIGVVGAWLEATSEAPKVASSTRMARLMPGGPRR